MRHLLLTGIWMFLSVFVFAQSHMVGLWEGTITDGIHAKNGKKFSLYLDVEGSQISGQTRVIMDNGQAVDMEVRGRLFSDRSMYFEEVKFLPVEGISADPPFNRKYQLFYFRSIFDSTIDGYWQDIRDKKVLDQKRPRGRIFLKKVEDPSKA